MVIYRKHAHDLIQNVVISFAFTVVAIRLYLEFSPLTIVMIGDFHVAHMLYGGIFLFLANLAVLISQNSRMLTLSSWLSGIGFGFFIDEIGKYVSLNNDYYYKLAAPLIYLCFLATVFMLFVIKQRKTPTLGEKLHHALFDIQRIVEERLYLEEFPALKQNLKELSHQASQPLHRELADHLHGFVAGKHKKLILLEGSRLKTLNLRLRARAQALLQRRVIRGLVYVVFTLRIFWVIPSIILPTFGLSRGAGVDQLRGSLIETGLISGQREFIPFLMTVVSEVMVAIGLLVALGFIVLRKPGGYWLARRLLWFSVLFLGLFNIYFGQFSALISISIDAALLFILTKLYTTKRPILV